MKDGSRASTAQMLQELESLQAQAFNIFSVDGNGSDVFTEEFEGLLVQIAALEYILGVKTGEEFAKYIEMSNIKH